MKAKAKAPNIIFGIISKKESINSELKDSKMFQTSINPNENGKSELKKVDDHPLENINPIDK